MHLVTCRRRRVASKNVDGLAGCAGEIGLEILLTHPGEREVEEPQPRERDERERREGAQEPDMRSTRRHRQHRSNTGR